VSIEVYIFPQIAQIFAESAGVNMSVVIRIRRFSLIQYLRKSAQSAGHKINNPLSGNLREIKLHIHPKRGIFNIM
jgi:hypothetical protein